MYLYITRIYCTNHYNYHYPPVWDVFFHMFSWKIIPNHKSGIPDFLLWLPSLKLTYPWKKSFPKRKAVSKPPFFRDYVSFREGTPYLGILSKSPKESCISSTPWRNEAEVSMYGSLRAWSNTTKGTTSQTVFASVAWPWQLVPFFCCGDGDVWCGWGCLVGSLLE